MIQRKLKPCKTCGDPSYIWAHGNCKRCDGMARAHKAQDQAKLTHTEDGKEACPIKINVGDEFAVLELNDDGVSGTEYRVTSVNPSRKAIKPISDKQAARLRKYRIARDEYFKENPVCEYPGCSSRNITLHHGAGRIGDLLFDKRWFKSLCGGLNGHHTWAEDHPEDAKAIGLSFDRLTDDKD